MAEATLRIEGLADLLKKIDTLAQLRQVQGAIRAAALHVKGKVAVYPPETAANKPGRTDRRGRPMGWYERGAGWHSASGKLYARSETLGRKWTIKTENAGLTAVIGNNASYARYVQDADLQARFMAAYGWRTAQDVLEQESDLVTRYVREAVEKAVAE